MARGSVEMLSGVRRHVVGSRGLACPGELGPWSKQERFGEGKDEPMYVKAEAFLSWT